MTAYHKIKSKSKARNVLRTGIGIHPTLRNEKSRRSRKLTSFLSQVTRRTGVSEKLLKQKNKGSLEISTARQLFMKLAYENAIPKQSRAKIGLIVNRDNATVLHAERAINDLIDTDKAFKELHDQLQKSGNFRRLC